MCPRLSAILILAILSPLAPSQNKPAIALAATPPMGWNSWNWFAEKVTDKDVRQAADLLVSSGMRDAGYVYVNIDDAWEGARDTNGNLHSNDKFPDMKALADYVHDLCSFHNGVMRKAHPGDSPEAMIIQYKIMRDAYERMHRALLKTGRPIVYSLCQYGFDSVWQWGPEVGANLWRTTADVTPTFDRISLIGREQAGLARYAGPGHWNDPDMLEVGNGKLTPDENRTHMGLWAMLAAPLLAGNNLSRLTPEITSILTKPTGRGCVFRPASIGVEAIALM
jgi:alpha-galactosidase